MKIGDRRNTIIDMLRKVRGGATIDPGKKFESGFRLRQLRGQAARTQMARAAPDPSEPGMTVMTNHSATAALPGGLIVE